MDDGAGRAWLDRPVTTGFIVLVAAAFAVAVGLRQHDVWWLIMGAIAFSFVALATAIQIWWRRRQASEPSPHSAQNSDE